MEYLAGETLGKYLERQGRRLPVEQVLNFGQQIALALAAAHDKHIVHRVQKRELHAVDKAVC
jgi:serine/threonine protein kinase